AATDPAFGASGLGEGIGHLSGTSAVADEAVGNGRSVLFAFDPLYRAWTQGTERLVWNAIMGPNPTVARGLALRSPDRVAAIRVAREAAVAVSPFDSATRIAVAKRDARVTRRLLGSYGLTGKRIHMGGTILFLIQNRRALDAEEQPFFAPLLIDLKQAGVH